MNTPRTATNAPMFARNSRLLMTAKMKVRTDPKRLLATIAIALIVYCAGVLTGVLAMTAMTAIILASAN